VSNTSKELARAARRHGSILILLAQISSDVEKRPKLIPIMGDLKESGQLEQDADVILFGVWPYRINHGQPKENYHVYVVKNRNREIKRPMLDLRFNA
jgi:replicative DNA helicase